MTNKKQEEEHEQEIRPNAEEMESPEAMQFVEDISALQTELEKLRADAEEAHDRYLRTLADFDNFRKRQREETVRAVNFAREEIILKILPVLDNLERSLKAAEEKHSYDSLLEGVQLTLRQFAEALAKEGVEQIEAVGQPFDPELHEAMMRVDTDEYPENTVVDEFEKGYTLNGKVLRPSRVRVAADD